MNLIGSKVIETNRLILRATEEQDLEILFNILKIPEVNKYYLTSKIGESFEEEFPWQMKKLKRAKDKDVFQWSIVIKDNNKCIGQISVQESKDNPSDIRDIGWFIDPSEQRKGYAFEAAENVIKYMFNDVEIKGIITSSAVHNPASFKLMEKLGFIRKNEETIKHKYTFIDEEVDCYQYELMHDKYFN
jgi:Acetyltransferases, including N-acetylases of ribosomal proteins